MGTAIVLVIVGAAVLAPSLAPADPDRIDVSIRFAGPSVAHWLGTDQLGRDLLSRLLYGANAALALSVSAVALAAVVGSLLGVAAGSSTNRGERPFLIVFDVLSAFPSLVLALAIIATVGPSNEHLVFVVATGAIPYFGRLARAQTLSLRSAAFLDAERVLGASRTRIFLIHLLPNIAGPLIALAIVEIPVVISIEAGLSFIGLGAPPPLANWGTMLYDGFAYVDRSPLPLLVCCILFAVVTVGFTLFGEALREALDPRSDAKETPFR